MKLIIIALSVIACIISYDVGLSNGKHESIAASQTSCVLAVRMAVDEVCVNPKVCEQYKK
jgi:hypothetical protein